MTRQLHRNTFSEVITLAIHGNLLKAWRQGWNGMNIWISPQYPDSYSKMTEPYFYIEYPAGHPSKPEGGRVPWLASQPDMFGQDWTIEVLEDPKMVGRGTANPLRRECGIGDAAMGCTVAPPKSGQVHVGGTPVDQLS